MVKKIAILTSGGDAPGMNAAVRFCVRAGLAKGKEMYVVYDGYKGLVEGDIHQVTKEFTADIINRGGTIIRSARLPEFKDPVIQKRAIQQLHDFEIDALIGIGGDGTYKGLRDLSNLKEGEDNYSWSLSIAQDLRLVKSSRTSSKLPISKRLLCSLKPLVC